MKVEFSLSYRDVSIRLKTIFLISRYIIKTATEKQRENHNNNRPFIEFHLPRGTATGLFQYKAFMLEIEPHNYSQFSARGALLTEWDFIPDKFLLCVSRQPIELKMDI